MKRRLLVVRLSALGDVIHTIPAVMSLLDEFEVSWVVEKAYAELVQVVTGVEAIPVRLKKFSLNRIFDARESVRDDFAAAVDFQGLIKSAVLTWSSGAAERYGFAREFVREKQAAWFYNRRVPIDPARHVVDWNVQLANALTRNPVDPSTRGPGFAAFARDAEGRLAAFSGRIVLLPGAGRPEKQWPVERFRDLVAQYGDDAVVVCGPNEFALAEKIGGRTAPETNLRELAFILQNARVVVGGDTGPLHLADALGTRVVGLYGPTDPRRNGPYGQLHHTIRADSLAAIQSAEVIRKVDEVLAE